MTGRGDRVESHRDRKRPPGGGGTTPAAAQPGTPPLHFAWSSLVGAVFAALYLALAPGVTGPRDAAELTLVLALNGVPHPTGYPLYVMAGHPFVRALHAAGAGWAYASNAWSALGGGVAIALLHALGARLVPPRAPLGRAGRFVAALVPAGILGTSPVWLLDAIFAEVYTWHLAWVAAAAWFTLRAMRATAEGRGRGPRPAAQAGPAFAWGLLCGLGLAHHLTSVLVIVPCSLGLALAAARARRLGPATFGAALLGTLLPLAAYGFVAWRAFHPAPYQWEPLEASWGAVLDHVRGAGYADLVGAFAPDTAQRELLEAHAYPVLFPALALLAVAAALARGADRAFLATLAAAAGLQTLAAFRYGVLDPSCYFEPPMALALLAVPALAARLPRRALPAAFALAVAAVAAMAIRGVPFGLAVRAGTVETDRRLRELWSRIPEGPGIVLWEHDMAAVFGVYQRLEGRRPELFAGNPATLSWPKPRRAFRARFGFDPLEGLEPLTRERAARVPENLSRLTSLPVTILDLGAMRVETLGRPAADSAGSGGLRP